MDMGLKTGRIPLQMLPTIVSSSEVYCVGDNAEGLLTGVKIAGILGDQQVREVHG